MPIRRARSPASLGWTTTQSFRLARTATPASGMSAISREQNSKTKIRNVKERRRKTKTRPSQWGWLIAIMIINNIIRPSLSLYPFLSAHAIRWPVFLSFVLPSFLPETLRQCLQKLTNKEWPYFTFAVAYQCYKDRDCLDASPQLPA